MKPYQTCWSPGYHKQGDFNHNLYKLSAYYLRKRYGEVHLISDNQGARFLEDIGFDSIDTSLESLPKVGSVIWSLGKVKAYELIAEKGEPFLHADNDVFLLKKLPDKIEKAGIFAQHIEKNIDTFYKLEHFHKNLPIKGVLGKEPMIKDAANMGIFGGRDLDFVGRYAREAYCLATEPANLNFLAKTERGYSWQSATLWEQYYVTLMAKHEDKEIVCLFETEEERDTKFEEYGYTHMLGSKNEAGWEEKVYTILYYLDLKPRGESPWGRQKQER